jgi:glycosyltransferase involved in cell wall biosynthesis
VKILHVSADWKWTGPAEPMLHAVHGLREQGHAVDLAAPEAPPDSSGALLERARARGIEPIHVMERGQGWRPWRDRREQRALAALLVRERYDVVHVHHSRDHLLVLRALGSAQARTRLVASWHHGDPVPARPWNRWLLGPRRLAGLTVLSERLADAAVRELGWPAERIAVLPGVVDVKHFAPRERAPQIAESLGLAPGTRAIGIVARLQPHRRFDLLLDAFALALRDAPDLRLIVVGRGTRARAVLEEPVLQRGLQGQVIRAGYRREDFRDVLAWFDALLFLVPGSDGSCRAALEAMAMGIPVIASQRGILPEIVSEDNGLCVPERPEALAAALVDVARSPARWRVRGSAARLAALRRHPVERHAQRLAEFYARLRSEPAARG